MEGFSRPGMYCIRLEMALRTSLADGGSQRRPGLSQQEPERTIVKAYRARATSYEVNETKIWLSDRSSRRGRALGLILVAILIHHVNLEVVCSPEGCFTFDNISRIMLELKEGDWVMRIFHEGEKSETLRAGSPAAWKGLSP